MIPITASYFAQHGGGSRRTALRRPLLLGAGIVGTFTAVGLATSTLAGAAGLARFAASPWVNMAIAAMFPAFALNLFGLYGKGETVATFLGWGSPGIARSSWSF